VLTFNEARRLAEVFASIPATTDKPARFEAVYIEERPNNGGFVVRFATNSGTLEEKDIVFHRIINVARYERKSGMLILKSSQICVDCYRSGVAASNRDCQSTSVSYLRTATLKTWPKTKTSPTWKATHHRPTLLYYNQDPTTEMSIRRVPSGERRYRIMAGAFQEVRMLNPI